MPRDIPIIFSGPMVRALLDGRKTMTRRLAWRPYHCIPSSKAVPKTLSRLTGFDGSFVYSPWRSVTAGDRLYVRENFAYVGTCDPGFLTFQATYPDDLAKYGMQNVPATLKEAGYKWTPCIHMPRKLSRLTLVITDTKIERLQDISEIDAIAEGIEYNRALDPIGPCKWRDYGRANAGVHPPQASFQSLWGSLHGAQSWRENPEVVALSFRVIRTNIDALEAA